MSVKWSEVEEKVAADMLARGFKCNEVAAVLQRSLYEVLGWLYRQREKYNWQMPDEFIFAKILGRDVTIASQERALQNFKPMFTVDVTTGQVKLDQIKEVLGYEYSVN